MDALGVLQRLGRGTLIGDIGDALNLVARDVVATGKPGSVTVTLKVVHPTGADPMQIVIAEEVKRTPPKRDPKGAAFYAIEDELYDRDPRQPQLPSFRVVNEETGEFRDVPVGEATREAGEN